MKPCPCAHGFEEYNKRCYDIDECKKDPNICKGRFYHNLTPIKRNIIHLTKLPNQTHFPVLEPLWIWMTLYIIILKTQKKKHVSISRVHTYVVPSIQWVIWLSICLGVLLVPTQLSIASRRRIMPPRVWKQGSKMLFVSVSRIHEGAVSQRISSWKISTPSSGQKVYQKWENVSFEGLKKCTLFVMSKRHKRPKILFLE